MIKRAFSVLLALCLLLGLCPGVLAAETDSGQCGENLNWRIDGGVLSITGTGPMWDYTYIHGNNFLITLDLPNGEKDAVVQGPRTTADWTDYNDVVTSVVIGEGVTSVGNWAFAGMIQVQSVSLPESLETIGPAAFTSCVRLREITIPDAVTDLGSNAFTDCFWLRRARVGAGVKELSCFSGCMGLEEVTLPAGLEVVGTRAFYVCSALKELELPASVKSIGDMAFYGTALGGVFALGAALEKIETTSFGGTDITAFTVDPANPFFYAAEGAVVSKDGTLAAVPGGVTQFTVPAGVKEVPESLFDTATKLERISLPEGLERIGRYAFYCCYALRGVSLPSTLKSIGDSAFEGCHVLTEIDLPEGLESIGQQAFAESALRRVRVPDSVTNIGRNAFRYCNNLDVFELGSGFTKLACVMDCPSLRSLVLPAELTEIAYGATSGDYLLQDVYFRGSAEDWEAVENADERYHNVTPLSEAELHLAGTWTEADVTARRQGSGEISWRLVQNNRVLIISGEGPMPDYAEDQSDVPWKSQLNNLKAVIVEEGVTHLGANAFKGALNLHTISLPASLRTIGPRALSIYYDQYYPVYNYLYYAGSSRQWQRVAFPEDGLGMEYAFIRYGVQDVLFNYWATAEHTGAPEGPLPGDVDLDGAVTAADAGAIFALVSAGGSLPAGANPDANGDGKVNARDALLAFRMAAN